MNSLKKILIFIICMVIATTFLGCDYLNIDFDKDHPRITLNKISPEPTEDYDPNKVYSEDEIFQLIIDLVIKQQEAMIEADESSIIETINPVDSWLQLEAKHLVADQKIMPVKEYSKTVSDIIREGAYYTGTVKQSFVFEGTQKQSIEQRYYMFEEGRVYDMGTVLEKSMWGNVFAAFPSDKYQLAKDLSEVLNTYVDSLNVVWKAGHTSPISVKIYGDKNTFLYNTKLSMPDWAGGWYESGESIKTYIYDTSQETYEYMMRHEATHMLLAHTTNDNASYWMQEGFATTMPEYVLSGQLLINRKDVVKEAYDTGRLPTVSEHVNTNIEMLSDMFDVRLYYGYSSAMVVYLLERTDDATLLRLFEELKTYPYISLTMGEKAYDTQAITEKCFKKATGKSFDDFYSNFNSWLVGKLT